MHHSLLAPRLLVLLGLSLVLAPQAPAQESEGASSQGRVEGAHEKLPPGSFEDDLGITIPIPASHSGRRYPATGDFPTGPAIGQRLPEFELPNQSGEVIDFHADRGDSKAIVVFFRSAVW